MNNNNKTEHPEMENNYGLNDGSNFDQMSNPSPPIPSEGASKADYSPNNEDLNKLIEFEDELDDNLAKGEQKEDQPSINQAQEQYAQKENVSRNAGKRKQRQNG